MQLVGHQVVTLVGRRVEVLEAAAAAVVVVAVVVPVVVKDKEGNYVRGLKKEDFLLLADDKPREISYFNTCGTAQFNIALVIDLSGSMRYKIHAVLRAARNFLEIARMRHAKDERTAQHRVHRSCCRPRWLEELRCSILKS